MTSARLGIVVNPIAGMGGRVALHGTDGDALEAARSRGAVAVAPLRARRALARLQRQLTSCEVLAAGGEMGGRLLTELGWAHSGVLTPACPSGPDDTRAAVRVMREHGVDLVLFVGGDGTARDVAEAAGPDLPVLGVPSGVKMHSGVFATTPEAAADTASRYLNDPARVGTVGTDIVDVVETGGGPRLLATARVPASAGGLQHPKAGASTRDDADLAALGRQVAGSMVPGRLYLLGPGTTVAHVASALGVSTSLLGVDAVLDGRSLGSDRSEPSLRELIGEHPDVTLILGVVGGQGYLLGRGNQQLSPAVVEAVGADNIMILAAAGKVAALDPPVLRVDLGDEAPVNPVTGYRRVHTGPGRSTVLKIQTH